MKRFKRCYTKFQSTRVKMIILWIRRRSIYNYYNTCKQTKLFSQTPGTHWFMRFTMEIWILCSISFSRWIISIFIACSVIRSNNLRNSILKNLIKFPKELSHKAPSSKKEANFSHWSCAWSPKTTECLISYGISSLCGIKTFTWLS